MVHRTSYCTENVEEWVHIAKEVKKNHLRTRQTVVYETVWYKQCLFSARIVGRWNELDYKTVSDTTLNDFKSNLLVSTLEY